MPRLIEFEGRQIEVPDDFSDDDIAVVLGSGAPAVAQPQAPAVQPVPGAMPAPPISLGDTQIDWHQQAPVAPTTPEPTPEPARLPGIPRVSDIAGRLTSPEGIRGLTIGSQATGRGIADVLGAPVDLATLLLNVVGKGANLTGLPQRVLGSELPAITNPIGGSEGLRQSAARGAEALGVKLYDENEMTPQERIVYSAERGATQGLAGAAGATRALAGAAARTTPPTTLSARVGDAIGRPYVSDPGKTALGDVFGGAGAMTGAQVASDAPMGDTPIGQLLASVLGSIAGVGVLEGARTAGRTARGMTVGRTTDTNIPLDAETGQAFTRGDTEQAARLLQSLASNPEEAARSGLAKRDELLSLGVSPSAVPTFATLTDDIGLQASEGAARTKNSVPFAERDRETRRAATEAVGEMRDIGADIGAVTRRAEQDVTARQEAARRPVEQIEGQLRGVQMAREAEGAQVRPLADERARNRASERLDRALVEDTYLPARAEKNRQFEEAPGRTQEVPSDSVREAAARIRAGNNALRPEEQLPTEFLQRLDRLVDEDGNVRAVTGGELADTRKYLSTAYERANEKGNHTLAGNISVLRRAINETLEGAPGYEEANRNYRQFAETFRPQPTDEMAKFTREVDRGQRGPASETAGRFLNGPERLESLRRVLAQSPSREAGIGAVRDTLIGDLAGVGLNQNGTLNWNRLSKWAQQNSEAINAFPEVSREIGGILARARRGERLTSEMEGQLREATQRAKLSERDIERSAAGVLLREDPRDFVRGGLTGGYGAKKRLREGFDVVKNDPEALRGYRAAVADVLSDMVTGTTRTAANTADAGRDFRVEASKIKKVFKDNEADLAEILKPADMNNLRRAHAVLEPLVNATVRATAGSNTADKAEQIWRISEAGLKAKFGALRGGSYMRTLRILASTLPDNNDAIQKIILQGSFNPDVASYLLAKKLPNMDYAASNKWVQRIIAGGAAARATGGEDDGAQNQR